MFVDMKGTRGSAAVSGIGSIWSGGDTTCVRVGSPCLPADHWLLVDAGTGAIPASWEFIEARGKSLTLLQTHYHHDHTQGFLLSAFPYLKHVPIEIWGPYDRGCGAREVYRQLMHGPYFPVEFDGIGSHIVCHNIENPNITVLLFHPIGGVKQFRLDEFERIYAAGKQIRFTTKRSYSLQECLLVSMFRSNHPEQTISYRFTEYPTGQSFVFLTDHESQSGIPVDLRMHVLEANLLVEDCQYTTEDYQKRFTGWGHADPGYVSRLALAAAVKALGLTHHNPASTDYVIDAIVADARRHIQEGGTDIPVFACFDGLRIDVGDVAGSVTFAQHEHKKQLIEELQYIITNR